MGYESMKQKTKFKQIEDWIIQDDFDINKFKKLIFRLYLNFPNLQIKEGEIKKVIVTEKMRELLVKNGYLIKEPTINEDGEQMYYYSLGPNSLSLVSSWKTEELTEKMKNLTYWVIGLTLINILLVLIQTIKIMFG